MIRTRRWTVTSAAALAGLVLVPAGGHPAAAAAPAITVTAFANPFPADDVAGLLPEKINERGQMIGTARHRDGQTSPVIWEAGSVRRLIPDTERGLAVDLSDRGQVVVMTFTRTAAPYSYFLWQDGTLTRIETGGRPLSMNDNGDVVVSHGPLGVGVWRNGTVIVAPGASDYYGYYGTGGINNRGQVAVNYGWGATIQGTLVLRAYWLRASVWQVGGGRTAAGPMFSVARAINESGQVAGFTYTSGPDTRAFLSTNGRTVQLGTLGGTTSDVVALNDQGVVIGTSTTAAGDKHAFVWRAGRMTDLGTLGGESSVPTAINNRGQIVGRASTATGEDHAVLWQDGQTIDLGALASSTGTSSATDISDRGQIAGSVSETPTTARAVMWTMA